MTKLKQLNKYPNGDCMRTVFACLLDYDNPELIPNFSTAKEGFTQSIEKWLLENDLEYIEISGREFFECPFTPIGYCGISGKSPRGEYNHIVVGRAYTVEKEDGLYREVEFLHDPSPFHDGKYIDGDIKWIGFLVRSLHGGK